MIHIRKLRHVLAGLILISMPCAAFAQSNLSQPLPQDTKVIKGTLPNGLTYYIRPNRKPEKKVELRLVVNAGSILEDNDQQGLAHFMEHMNFNGTKHFEKNDLVNYLQSIGVQFGADLNAYTSFDETVFILPVPTDKPGNLDKGFQIIEDWAHNALLTDKDIDDERAVVLEESRLGKGADQRMMDKYLPSLLSGSRYADRLPIGKDDILKSFKHESIRRFYKDWYRPDLQAVVVAGDIDTATALKMIKQYFSGLTNPVKEKKRFFADVPARTKPEAMVLTDKEATNYQLQIIYPSVKKEDEHTLGDYRSGIVRQLMVQMLNRRLSDLARSSNPPFPYAGTGFDGWARGYESFTAYTVFGNEGPEKSLNALTAEIARAKKYGFTANELDIASKNTLSGMEKMYNERNTTESSNLVDEYIRNFLENESMPGIEREYSYYKNMLPGIKLEEINSLAKKWMSPANIYVLLTGPQKDSVKLPNNAALLAMTQKGLQQDPGPYQEKEMVTTLMDKLPTPGKVISKQEESEFGATTYTLSNGIKVTVKPTDFKSDEIIVKGVKKGGTNNYGTADKYSAQFAASVVSAMGISHFTPTDLEKILAGKNAKASASIGNIQNTVYGSSSVKDVETMFQLLYLQMMQPRKDEALFKAYKDKQKMQLQFVTANPQVGFIDTTFKVLYSDNPLAPSPVPKPEHFDAINLDRAMSIYKNEISSADGYHFFIVGNVKPETIIPYIERYLGSIPVANKTPSYKDNGVRAIRGSKQIHYKKGKEPQSLIVAVYHGNVKYSEDLELQAEALAEILNIKVIEDLREKLGGIYTGGYYASVSKEPYEHYSIGMQLPCGPENVDKLLKAADEEIRTLKEKGPDAKDLDKVKAQWHEKHRTDVKENSYWSEELEEALFWNQDKQHILSYDKWIDDLNPSDIQNVAKKLLGKDEFISILYPES